MARPRKSQHDRPITDLPLAHRELWLGELRNVGARLRLAGDGLKNAMRDDPHDHDALWGAALVVIEARHNLHALAQDINMTTRVVPVKKAS